MTDKQLDPREATLAGVSGVQRTIGHRWRGDPGRFGCDKRDPAGYSTSVQGTQGECHVAKNLGLWWPGGAQREGTEGDLPGNLGVRARTLDWYELLIHDDDPDERRFVLVVGMWPRMRMVGWLAGAEAKNPEWWNEAIPEPAYTVPHSALRPMSDIEL